jgi:hypothetical protein
MGAVLGIAAFGRTQEKLNGANNGGAQLPSSNFTSPSIPSAGFGSAPGGFGSFGSQPLASGSGFGGVPKSTAPTIMTSSTGKPMPVQPEQPEL